MFFKKIDMISPPITLYYKGEDSHSSIFSGILTIVAYGITIAFGIYYFYTFLTRSNPSAFFFNRYVEDAGEFPVNASSMFHFIQVLNTQENTPVEFEFDKMRVIGIEEYIDTYVPDKKVYDTDFTDGTSGDVDITAYNHWLYDYCNNDSDTKGIGYLIEKAKYLKSACIRYYYNKDDKKYYKTNEKGFVWPNIIKGCSNPDRTYYGIVLERCNQDADSGQLGVKCASRKVIDDYIDTVSLDFEIIDHYADVLNYEQPFTKYFYSITNGIYKGSYTTNHLNFNPAIMNTHNGIFFDNLVETTGYFFDQNEKVTESTTVNDVLVAFYFWMQNRMQYYERNYDRLQDVLSDVGGIASIVMVVAVIINYLVGRFVTMLDTEDLILDTDGKNFGNPKNGEEVKKPTIFKNANQLANPPRHQKHYKNANDYSNSKESANYLRLMKEGVNVTNNPKEGGMSDEKNEQYKNMYLKKNNKLNNYFQEDSDVNVNKGNKQNKNEEHGKNQGDNNLNNNEGSGQQYENKNQGITYSRNNENNNKRKRKKKRVENTTNRTNINMVSTSKRDDDRPTEKAGFNFCHYLKYVICCFRYNDRIRYYEDFRREMISEETFMQNQLDIYKLKKVFEENTEIRNNIQPKKPKN